MPATVIVGAQWGDEGKGKIVDLLAQESDVVCRYQGGPNAGHTIIAAGETYKIRQIPTGILSGRTAILGAGCVVDPEVLGAELDAYGDRGTFYLSGNAHLIMPWHVAIDQASERRLGKLQIGTTRRGIGPAYADKASRIGIRVQDLLDPGILRKKLEMVLREKNQVLVKVYNRKAIDVGAVVEEYLAYAERLRPYIADTRLVLGRALENGETVLLEGAQATLLDVDHGTYPFVTSSSPTAGGACVGSGIPPTRISQVIGVIKAYTTRVGAGPFPTELFDDNGTHLAKVGVEFGTTTGRPRRVGWFDAVVGRYAVRVNGISDLVVTKLDVLSGLPKVPICVGYEVDGQRVDEMPMTQTAFHHATPVYEELDGWWEDVAKARSFADLPLNAQRYVERIESLCGARVSVVGVGPGREENVVRHPLV